MSNLIAVPVSKVDISFDNRGDIEIAKKLIEEGAKRSSSN